MSVHTLYFWRDLSAGFREMARIMKPGGKAVLLFRTSANDKVNDFSNEVYCFRTRANVVAAMKAEGFSILLGGQATDEPALLVAIRNENQA